MAGEELRELAKKYLSNKPQGLTWDLAERLKQVPLDPHTPIHDIYDMRVLFGGEPWARSAQLFRNTLIEHASDKTVGLARKAIREVGHRLANTYRLKQTTNIENESSPFLLDYAYSSSKRQTTIEDMIHALSEVTPDVFSRRENRIQLAFLVAVFL